MKTTLRIVTLSLALGLAGALVTAWGAESVMDLISQGETVITKVKSAKAALDAGMQKNDALKAQGPQLQAESAKLTADDAAYKQAATNLNQKIADYKIKCKSPATDDQFKACKAENIELKQELESLSTQPASINARVKSLNAAVLTYDEQIKDFPNQFKATQDNYTNALKYQYDWMDRARDQVAQPAFQPYAKKYHCPNVMKPPKTQAESDTMTDQILSCLKRVVNSG